MTSGYWMQLYGGRAFDPFNPDPADINITDIAHALSNICRYGGHSSTFYSVAEHSVHVARSVPREDARWGLLHDSAEAYLGDLIHPLKQQLPGYLDVEARLACAIATRFGLPCDEPASVKDADLRICQDERQLLLGPEPAPWRALTDIQPLGVEIMAFSPWPAKALFLNTFEELFQ